MKNSSSAEIVVGQGATYAIGSDRYPYTVTRIISPTRVAVQQDHYRRTDKNGFSELQEYEYTPNPSAQETIVTLRRNGTWHKVGDSQKSGAFSFNGRRAYQDPSF